MGSSEKTAFPSAGLSHSEKVDLPEQIAEWKLEPELACPIPRKIVLKEGVKQDFFAISFLWVGIAVATFSGMLLDDNERLGFLTVLSGGIALAVLIYRERRRRLSKLLVAKGLATRGVVVEDKGYHSGEGDIYQWVVGYDAIDTPRLTLTLQDGDTVSAVGDTLTILYLRGAPERAMAYKECDYMG